MSLPANYAVDYTSSFIFNARVSHTYQAVIVCTYGILKEIRPIYLWSERVPGRLNNFTVEFRLLQSSPKYVGEFPYSVAYTTLFNDICVCYTTYHTLSLVPNSSYSIQS